MTRSFSYALPGSMYEVSPDYGMMTQAWNIYGFAVPIIEQFFGIQPFAFEKAIIIRPQLPTEWQEVSLENVAIGENRFSISIKSDGNEWEYHLKQDENYTLKLELEGNDTNKIKIMEGEGTIITNTKGVLIESTGNNLKVMVSNE